MIKDITLDNSLRAILGNSAQPEKSKEAGEGSFVDVLKNSISEVNDLQKAAEVATGELLKGSGSIHNTVIAVEEADLSFRLMMKVRGKIVDAYQEVMRMQV